MAAVRYNAPVHYGEELRATLPAGGFGEILYVYGSIGSTNTRATELAVAGAVQGTLVVADHQTRGRGRAGTRWFSPAGSSVTMSLILRPAVSSGLRWSGLGALAVAKALGEEGLSARIKWPNDVLIDGRKAAGVLVEAAWEGGRPLYMILGIGINVGARSAPQEEDIGFPATTVEGEARRPVSRTRLIAGVLRSIESWYGRVETPDFLGAWEAALAYRGERVRVQTSEAWIEGRLVGLGPAGEARIEMDSGDMLLAGGDASQFRPSSLPLQREGV